MAKKKKPPYITITNGMRGYFAVLVDGETGEPINSSMFSYKTSKEAEKDGKFWARAEELEFK